MRVGPQEDQKVSGNRLPARNAIARRHGTRNHDARGPRIILMLWKRTTRDNGMYKSTVENSSLEWREDMIMRWSKITQNHTLTTKKAILEMLS